MKIKLVFSIVVLCNAITFANLSITKECNLPRNGDSLTKQWIEYINPGEDGENIVWDFSTVEVVDGNYIVSYISYGDSLISLIDNDTKYDYKICKDTLLWKGFENSLTLLSDSLPAVAMVYPFKFGQKCQKDFYQKGVYSKTMTIAASGKSRIVCDATGILILPNNDTVTNVIRVHKTNTSLTRVSRNNNDIPIDINQDTLTVHVEDSYSWYADGYRYPIVETISHSYKCNNRILNSFGTAFICSPEEQIFNNSDSQNEEKRKSPVNSKDVGGHSQYDGPDSAEDSNGNNSHVTLTQDSESVTISCIPSENTEISATLTDLQGRVFGYVPKQNVGVQEPYSVSLSTSGLLSGDYLMHISIGTIRQIKKFSIR